MADRRYTEEEVALIFERAAAAQQAVRRQLPAGEGMTLGDLTTIGNEVGIPAELVQQAARSLDVQGKDGTRLFLGLPLGVGRTVDLGRRISDDEWERLVVDLRETFDARGSVRADGSLRQWTNGNLQVLLEPTPAGHRLRMKTLMGASRGMMGAGLTLLGGSTFLAIVSAIGGETLLGALSQSASFIAAGAAIFAMGAARLPGWARTRRAQMEGVAARLALQAGEDDKEELAG